MIYNDIIGTMGVGLILFAYFLNTCQTYYHRMENYFIC